MATPNPEPKFVQLISHGRHNRIVWALDSAGRVWELAGNGTVHSPTKWVEQKHPFEAATRSSTRTRA